MSWKSVRLSIYSLLLFIGAVLGIIFLFKFNILLGFAGIVLLIIPAILQRKALDAADGIVDKVIAKFIVPTLFLIITFLAIMSIALWI